MTPQDKRVLLDQLAEVGRRLRVGRPLPAHGPLTSEVIRQVQTDLRAFVEAGGSVDDLSQALGEGFAASMLLRFMRAESFAGLSMDVDRIARAVNALLEQIAQRKEARLPDGFVETRVARRMLTVVEQSVRLGGLGLVVAPSGIGKSIVFDAARQMFPGSLLVRVRESCRTGPGLIRHLAQALHVRGASNAISAQAAVLSALAGTNRLLMIDEAHRLADNALEMVRDLHDEGGNLPVVLAGTITLLDRVEDEGEWAGQLSSRVVVRYNALQDAGGVAGGGSDGTRLFTVEEIQRLYASSRVRLTSDGWQRLTDIACIPGWGSLRLAGRLLEIASTLGEGKPIDGPTLLSILRATHGKSSRLEREVRAMEIARTA